MSKLLRSLFVISASLVILSDSSIVLAKDPVTNRPNSGKVLQATTQSNGNFFSNFFQPLTSAVSNTITKIQYVFVKGDQGNKGDKGDTGERGSMGPQGEKGDKGDAGLRGIQGITGLRGEKGEQGLSGNSGNKGDRGDKGDTGSTGLQGIQGIAGSIGVDGPSGPMGLTGSIGPQGTVGATGPQGIQGLQGIQGIAGETYPYTAGSGLSLLGYTFGIGSTAITDSMIASGLSWDKLSVGNTSITSDKLSVSNNFITDAMIATGIAFNKLNIGSTAITFDKLNIGSTAITNDMLAGSISVDKLAGGITNDKLAIGNTSITNSLLAGGITIDKLNLASLNIGISNLYVGINGNVGIGTTNPLNTLHVLGIGGSAAGIYLNDATPGTTTNTLYNAGGSLFFNGAVVGGSGGDVGDVKYVAQNTCPTGWFKADGTAKSRTTYSTLFAAIGTTYGVGDNSTTFNIPDMRGQFVRSWDDGKGVDTSRGIGTTQTDDFKSHQHSTPTGNAVYTAGNGGNQWAVYSSSGAISGATGGTETRPKNIAFLGCIKY